MGTHLQRRKPPHARISLAKGTIAGSLAATTKTDSGRGTMNKSTKMGHQAVLRVKLEVLKREHRDLDDAIHALQDSGRADPLRLRRLKKKKLFLKDQIASIDDELTPDIIA
jgi:hypothetical protein